MTSSMEATQSQPNRRSRRALLTGALAGVGAWALAAAGRVNPVRAIDGDVVHVGDELTGSSPTKITNPDGYALWGVSTSSIGVRGNSSSDSGVYGISDTGPGVRAFSGSSLGVDAWSGSATEAAVRSQSAGNSTGVEGYSGSVTPAAKPKTGVYGSADQDSSSRGVWGESPAGQGVRGQATSTGVGGYFSAPSTGIALQAAGKVKLSRSGKTKILAGHASKAITLSGVTSSSLIFAVLASNRSGRWVRAVVPATGSFTVYLNTSVSSDSYLSWFVLD